MSRLLRFLVSARLLALVLSFADWHEVWDVLHRVDLRWVAAALGLAIADRLVCQLPLAGPAAGPRVPHRLPCGCSAIAAAGELHRLVPAGLHRRRRGADRLSCAAPAVDRAGRSLPR